ncbi:MAG: hypothetical protein A2381_07545 [Bdellovibrionales bacterium RIFOXYB1_FULL_37_110]|nr:MAG: hypothetical protein A2181_04310 [Bdellovibrionales bacterium RIFOXYA1_FULL_38_20]OFZ52461.1 MAG: hypothetical protein A2417_00265 [Bdellovibrionales bacterium RIFOXYC1_FULL_37_79]OFZ59663.1 MAG: hypothetical protein A2381_07545 [Bdellovibrionales bacterium RIFOXYB1_FULL_37_110]OFZ62590.1 MAG: hypothetical protein A2577_11865 [Bdellovibrionales bacterium RIFOXYD1_FULL_36_51]
MLARKEQNSSGNPLPEIWVSEVLNLLNTVYSTQLKNLDCFLEFYGISYQDELFLAVSVINTNNRSISPTSMCLSIDLDPMQDVKKVLNTLVDALGILLDHFFDNPDSPNWQPTWLEETFKKINFYYMITREDISLTIEANKLLSGL